MFRALKQFRHINHLVPPPLPPLNKCHRTDCPCVQNIRKNMINVIRTTEGYAALEESKQKYKECYAIYKKWHL